MIRRFPFAVFALFVLVAFQFLPRASAQSPLRRLTATGDVMDFVWSPRGDELLVARAGTILTLSPTRQQVTGDLYRVNAASAQSELLARNANRAAPAPSGDELAFVRVSADGSARVIRLDPESKRELDAGGATWGTTPQWNGAGNALYYAQDGKFTRATRTGRAGAFGGQPLPLDARVSSSGEQVAFVNKSALWVTQGNSARAIVRAENSARVAPQTQWSPRGDQLAYIVTRDGFDPELWLWDAASGTTQKIAQGSGLEHFANLAWSPDDAHVIFTRTPTGSSGAKMSEIWRAAADGSELRALTHNGAEETLPQYAPDRKAIAFLRDGDVWVMELNADGLPMTDVNVSQEIARDFKTPRALDAQRTPPATIRVRHDAANACRSIPVGQIDTLDFETYVKRVVPAEVYPTWADDALKTQAVAARSYAWFWILQHTSWAYDVTDSTAYQYMCDTRYASTDSATDATRGQYLDYAGYMVFAAYGAENGDPTLTNTWGNPYLLGVDDPVGFMKTRAGNGIGMSQWGAQRWASQYGWNYQQILLHYYTKVTLQAAAGAQPDALPPIGAIISPWSNWGVTSNRVRFVVNASDDASGIASIALRARFFSNGGTVDQIIATLHGAQREFTWDVSALPNQTAIVVTPILYDAVGNSATGAIVTFDLDRKGPQGTLTAPAATTTQSVTLNLNAADDGGSGLTAMMFSNAWVWEGENQYVQENSGAIIADPDALNGSALRGLFNVHSAGAWYGPYTSVLPVNQPYRAYFRLKTDNLELTNDAAVLDVVVDGGATVLGLKRVRGVDFRAINSYQEFYVDFYYTGATTNGLEFRVAFQNTATLWLDRILVVRYPVPYAATASWTLTPGEGAKRVIAKFADGAGNISADAIAEIYFGTTPPPTPTPPPVLTPRVWLPSLRIER